MGSYILHAHLGDSCNVKQQDNVRQRWEIGKSDLDDRAVEGRGQVGASSLASKCLLRHGLCGPHGRHALHPVQHLLRCHARHLGSHRHLASLRLIGL